MQAVYATRLMAGKEGPAGARRACETDVGNITSYSCFITTNETVGNHMFFWYFPALDGNESAPLVIWLQVHPVVQLCAGDKNFTLVCTGWPRWQQYVWALF